MKLKFIIASLVLATCSAFAAPNEEAEAKLEKDLISAAPKKKIKREKDLLTIVLKNGKKKTYKDNPIEGSDKYIRHALVDYIAKNQTAVIQQHFYEGGQFLVVSMKDGSEIITSTKPTWSPDKSKFISVNDDESDYTDNRTVIGSCQKMKCAKIFSQEEHAGLEKWIDNKTVEYEHRKFDPGTGKSEVSNYICKLEKKVICSPKQ